MDRDYGEGASGYERGDNVNREYDSRSKYDARDNN